MSNPLPDLGLIQTGDDASSFLLVFQPASASDAIAPEAIVGGVLASGRSVDWSSFQPNRTFIDWLSSYFRGELAVRPELLAGAQVSRGENFFVVDGRCDDPDGDVAPSDIIGAYETDARGQPIASTFQYNPNHRLVEPSGSFSAVLWGRVLPRVRRPSAPSAMSASPDRTAQVGGGEIDRVRDRG